MHYRLMFIVLMSVGFTVPQESSVSQVTTEILEGSKIVATCLAATMVHGLSHFEIGYLHVVPEWARNRQDHAKCLGEVAQKTSLIGLCSSIPVVLACRVGSWPQLSYRDLLAKIAVLSVAHGAVSGIYGLHSTNEARKQIYAAMQNPFTGFWDRLLLWGLSSEAVINLTGYTQSAEMSQKLVPVTVSGLVLWILQHRYDLHLQQLEQQKNELVEVV